MLLEHGDGFLRIVERKLEALHSRLYEIPSHDRLFLDVVFHGPDTVGIEVGAEVAIDERADLIPALRGLLQHRLREDVCDHPFSLMIEQNGVLRMGVDDSQETLDSSTP